MITLRSGVYKLSDIKMCYIKLQFLHQDESRGITGALQLATSAHQQQQHQPSPSSNNNTQTPPRNLAAINQQSCPVQPSCPAGVSRALFMG